MNDDGFHVKWFCFVEIVGALISADTGESDDALSI